MFKVDFCDQDNYVKYTFENCKNDDEKTAEIIFNIKKVGENLFTVQVDSNTIGLHYFEKVWMELLKRLKKAIEDKDFCDPFSSEEQEFDFLAEDKQEDVVSFLWVIDLTINGLIIFLSLYNG